MSKITVKIKTWRCLDCDYAQDFDPDNAELMALHFPEGVEAGRCPACYLGNCPDRTRKKTKMVKETDPDKKTTLTVMGEEEVEDLEIQDGVDDEGNPKTRKLIASEKKAKIKEIREAVKRAKELEDK